MNTQSFRYSIRSLHRDKIYSLINLSGLAVAGAFILLIALYIRHAITIDKYSANLKNIYRIESTDMWYKSNTAKRNNIFGFLAKGADQKHQLVQPFILGEAMKQRLPEIRDFCRIISSYKPVIQVNNQRFREDDKRVVYVDKNFFAFFGLPLLNTAEAKAFTDNNSVVINEKTAKKYFGTIEVIGKVLSFSGEHHKLFTVSAVAKDFPSNSSMQFDILFPVESKDNYQQKMNEGVNSSSILTMIELQEKTNLELFRNKLTAFGQEYFKPVIESMNKFNPVTKEIKFNLTARSFSEGHYNASAPWFYFTDVKSLYQLAFLALIALGVACLNYILLSLSRVAARSQESGVRKTLGAGWKHIVNMFLTETFAMVLIAMIVGFILAVTVLPYFNKLANINMHVSELLNWKFVAVGICLVIVLTILAGIYPAIRMARIKPLSVLNKFSTYKLNPTLSKLFITIQYTACIVLIAYSIVVERQIEFVNNKDLGFDKEQILHISNPYWGDKEKTISLRNQLYQYASSQPYITGSTGSDFRFASISNRNGHNINGKKEMIAQMNVDYDFFEFNKISLIKGRYFSKEIITDTAKLTIAKGQLDTLSSRAKANLVVNETLYKMLGSPQLNEVNKSLGGVIVGVCRDYFFMGLQHKIEPAYHKCAPGRLSYFWFRIGRDQNIVSVTNKLKERFNEFTNGEEFEFSFMNEDIKTLYESHERWMKVINAASWMVIFISCLGLLGLTSIVAVNRTKEIGIRKVLGASVFQMFYSLNKQTFLLVLLSVIIASPIAVYIANSWLENFAYRISLNGIYFIIAGGGGLFLSIAAVSYHTLKAATANPVKSLRTE